MKNSLVLLSGLLSNETLWRHQSCLKDLAQIQIFSPTEETPHQMIQHILDRAPPKFALAGHSMGGWLCLEVMRVASHRVSKLCLINSTSRPDSEEKRNRRLKMIARVERGEFRSVVIELVDLLVYNPNAKKMVEKMFLEVGPIAFIHQERAMLARSESESFLQTIRIPTLVIHGAEDKNFGLDEQKELVEKIPGAELTVVAASGHMSPLERPEAVTFLLKNWLQ
jgi:pimeloyl-ACP methyl ester carboxylesterase